MHFFAFLKGVDQQQEQMISEEVMDEPPEEDEEVFTKDQDSFEIITDEEVARVKLPFCPSSATDLSTSSGGSWSSPPPPPLPAKPLISTKGSSSSLASNGTDPGSHPSLITRSSLSFLFRNNRNVAALGPAQLHQILEPVVEVEKPKKLPPQLTEEEMTSSTTRIWYIIQLQGHYNHGLEETEEEEEGCYYHPPMPPSKYRATATMENSSGKRTNWISSLLQIPEKIKQHVADRNRFNVHAISAQAKEELKHLYVY